MPTVYNLASLYKVLGDYAKAEPLYNQAIEIWKKTLGPEHPNVTTGLGHLSGLYAAMGDFKKSYDFILRTLELENNLLDQVMGFTSEDQKLKFVAMNNWSLYHFLNLVNQYLRQDQGKRKKALDVWLKRKGAILEIQKRYQEAIFYTGNPESAKLFRANNTGREASTESTCNSSTDEKDLGKSATATSTRSISSELFFMCSSIFVILKYENAIWKQFIAFINGTWGKIFICFQLFGGLKFL